MSYKRLGDYIQLVDKRNKDLAVTNLLGINIFKNYMPSVANQTGLDLSKYKVVKKGLFATNLMHVNRDEVLPIALYTDDEPALVSPAISITNQLQIVQAVFIDFLVIEQAFVKCDIFFLFVNVL
jgi:type I restriction enzyme S subunit